MKTNLQKETPEQKLYLHEEVLDLLKRVMPKEFEIIESDFTVVHNQLLKKIKSNLEAEGFKM